MSLVLHQFRYDQKAFWRNPASVFFTVMFPVLFFVILAVIFGSETVHVRGGVSTTTYYVPAIMTLSIISATMQTLVMTLVIAREDGRLKRGRGTPMPPWVFIAGRIGNSIVVALMMLVLLAAIGGVLYGVAIPWDRLPAILVTLAVGAAAFCCLGIALTAAIPSQDAAAPIVNALLSPSTSSPASSSPKTSFPAASSTSPTSSRSVISSTRSSTPTCPPAARPSPGTTSP